MSKASVVDILASLRATGWSVAVHNDYRLDDESFTFWLFTHPSGRWVKGEGHTDEGALREVVEHVLRDAGTVAPEQESTIRANERAKIEARILPLPAIIICPKCSWRHIDSGEWERKLHLTHLCASCGLEWQPFSFYAYGCENDMLVPPGVADQICKDERARLCALVPPITLTPEDANREIFARRGQRPVAMLYDEIDALRAALAAERKEHAITRLQLDRQRSASHEL